MSKISNAVWVDLKKKVYASYKSNPNLPLTAIAAKFKISDKTVSSYISEGLKNKW